MSRAFIALLLLVGCSHDLDRVVELEVQERNDRARRHVGRAEFDQAQTLYQQVLDYDDDHPEASVGWAISELLLLPTSEPVTELLTRCNQPALDLSTSFFGAAGLLARADDADLGSADLAVAYQQTDLTFEPTVVRTRIAERDIEVDVRQILQVTLRDAALRSIVIEVDIDDALKGDNMSTPLEAVVEANVRDLNGSLRYFEPFGGGIVSTATLTGRVRFESFGRLDGARVAFELIDAAIPVFCEVGPCDDVYLASGRVDDTLSFLEIPLAEVPFGTVSFDEGPPRRQEHVVALERCERFDEPFVTERVGALASRIAVLAGRLSAVRDDAFVYALPQPLLFTDAEILLGSTDVHALEAVSFAAAAALELVRQYRWFDGVLHDLLESYEKDGPVRDFGPAGSANFEANLFTLRADADFGSARSHAVHALEAAHLALTSTPTAGVLNLRDPSVRHLSNAYARLATALLASLDGQPRTIDDARGYTFHLAALFDGSLDRTRARALLGADPLVFFEDGEMVLAEPLVESPSLLLDQVRTAGTECPQMFQNDALESAVDRGNDDWPRFVDPSVRELFDITF